LTMCRPVRSRFARSRAHTTAVQPVHSSFMISQGARSHHRSFLTGEVVAGGRLWREISRLEYDGGGRSPHFLPTYRPTDSFLENCAPTPGSLLRNVVSDLGSSVVNSAWEDNGVNATLGFIRMYPQMLQARLLEINAVITKIQSDSQIFQVYHLELSLPRSDSVATK